MNSCLFLARWNGGKHVIFLVLLSFLILISVKAPSEAEGLPWRPGSCLIAQQEEEKTPAVKEESPSPPTSSPYAGDFDEALKSLNLQRRELHVTAAGEVIELPVYIQEKYRDIYISLSDEKVRALFIGLGTLLDVNVEEKTIRCTQNNGKIYSAKLDPAEITTDSGAVRLSPPPFLLRGQFMLALKHLPLFTRSVLSHDKDEKHYYIDPTVVFLALVPGQKRQVVKAIASGNFESTSFLLKNPRRLVVDLSNVHLSKNLIEMPDKEISHGEVGKILYSQNEVNPNRVRIVVPLSENVDVRVLPRKLRSEIEIALVPRSPNAVGMNFQRQAVSAVNLAERGKCSYIKIHLSGPVEYEWHRFKAPDDRFFIDIHNAVLAGKKKTMKPNDPHIEEIRVAQFQMKPEPVVRVAVELKDRYIFRVTRPPAPTTILTFEVSGEKISSDDMVLDGYGVTSYPRPERRVICIDPGHGGIDAGACNNALNLREKDITLAIARQVSALLVAKGWNVILTRTTDRDVSYYGSSDTEELSARVKVAREMKADIFISIHCDASLNRNVRGISTHWYKSIDMPLATEIHKSLLLRLKNKNRKIHQNSFYVIAYSKMPAVLIETAFISNTEDAGNLATPAYRASIAKAVAEGIEAYLKAHPRTGKQK